MRRGLIWVYKVKRGTAQFSPAGLEPLPRTSVAVRVMQYLNVCQRKLGTIIIQTAQILQHDSAVKGSPPEGEFLLGQSNLLPDNQARQ